MYKAFNITGVDWNALTNSSGVRIKEAASKSARGALDAFITSGAIDGKSLCKHWFPSIKADVFISHSHANEDAAIKCAGWLRDTFGLTAFIDSCVWGHANGLLREIDNKHCLNDCGKTYNYESRNGSTSHVHMMLSSALLEVMDNCECIFFLNTPASITVSDSVSSTHSPWIFHELNSMRFLRRHNPRVPQLLREHVSLGSMEKQAALKVNYEINLSHLDELNHEDLNSWDVKYNIVNKRRGVSRHPLDVLYGDFDKS